MNRLSIKKLNIDGLYLLKRIAIGDNRGFLSRMWCSKEMQETGWTQKIAQINHTYNQQRGTVRGLHFQKKPFEEKKLVSCIKGAIWDVAVDIRPSSPTYLHWHSEELSEKNMKALMIPEGFAHGYQTLTDDVELLYCHSEFFNDKSEGGLNPKDPKLSIDWPIEITNISNRDSNHPLISDTL